MIQAEQRRWQQHHGPLLDQRNNFDVIDCEVCRFKHVVPLPSADDLENLYRHDYYAREKPLYLERVEQDREWWMSVYDDRFDTFEAELPPDRRRILDVGSGPGLFLQRGKERGWDCLGIEPSRQAAEHARGLGLEIVNTFLSAETARDLGQFDVIHLAEVLEHISDPGALLQVIRSLLRPAGVLCVAVPNDYNPIQFALRSVAGFDPWWVAPPHHLNYFDRQSLGRLVDSLGFTIQSEEASFPIDLFLLMGENYVDDDACGRRCHGRRKQLELNLKRAGLGELKRQLYRQLATLGLGREIVLFARGPD